MSNLITTRRAGAARRDALRLVGNARSPSLRSCPYLAAFYDTLCSFGVELQLLYAFLDLLKHDFMQ